jgi:hypothetical protein
MYEFVPTSVAEPELEPQGAALFGWSRSRVTRCDFGSDNVTCIKHG